MEAPMQTDDHSDHDDSDHNMTGIVEKESDLRDMVMLYNVEECKAAQQRQQ